jgi:hypothetical protein
MRNPCEAPAKGASSSPCLLPSNTVFGGPSFRLIARPLVVISSRRLVKGRDAIESFDTVPINADVADVPIRKAHYVRRIVELIGFLAVVGASPAGAGKLAHEHDAGRLP